MLNKNSVTTAIIIIVVFYGLLVKCSQAQTTFTVIGDFGDIGTPLSEVSGLIHSWQPDFILTVGDNDYENDYSKSVLPYFDSYISSRCSKNKFYPTYGNHDWKGKNGYDEIFPCVSDYYKFTLDNIEFFTINSDEISNSQLTWLEDNVKASTAMWKVVFLHHSPFSSGKHGSNTETQLDFSSWGVDLVLSGHDHSYERIKRDDVYYFVNGLGGRAPYDFENCCVEGSQFRYNADNGAMRVDVNSTEMRIRFVNRNNTTIDDVTIVKDSANIPTSNVLKNGEAIIINGATGDTLSFEFELPSEAQNLTVALSGGTGDADLYIRYGEQPTSKTFDCRPWVAGNSESCSILVEQAGTWYVNIVGYSEFDHVNLVVTWID